MLGCGTQRKAKQPTYVQHSPSPQRAIGAHGVFAPNSRYQTTAIDIPKGCEARRSKMSWAMRLKRVFNIDITVCRHCQGKVRIIACIEEREVIDKILAHMNQQQQSQTSVQVSSCIRAPPIFF